MTRPEAPRPIFFNGKFYGTPGVNGVHRVADRLICEVDAILAALGPDAPPARLLLPENAAWEPALSAIQPVRQKGGHSQWWEQFVLPSAARGGVLVNLCNLAPLAHPAKLLMIHDAQFLFPDSSYPPRVRWGYRLLIPWMARTSARVLTVSDYSRQMLELFGVSRRSRTGVIHNGADHMLLQPADGGLVARLGLQPGAYAAHIGSPKTYKNTVVLFRAFARPELAGLKLVLVGPPREAFEDVGAPIPANAVFAGTASDAELRGLYEAAACVLLPSRTEGFGLPPVEAMLCGCPAVVAPCGAIPEVCRDAALYADVDDPQGWAAAVLSLAEDGELRARKVEAGRARAAALTWARAGEALLAEIMRVRQGLGRRP